MKTVGMILMFLILVFNASCVKHDKYAVIVSANTEWKVIKKTYPNEDYHKSPWGEYFHKKINNQDILFFHEGWGKVSAAGATQYVIDTFKPEILINIGTCGGIDGQIGRFDIVLADKTIIYDIREAIGNSKEAIAEYTTPIDLTWLGDNLPSKVSKTVLVSADKDLRVEEIEQLKNEYFAVAGDWESGAIAYTASLNKKKIIILRGVTDLVSNSKGESYGDLNLFAQRTDSVMRNLLFELPKWIDFIERK
jgi:adenosylhomocysteine nucleosidase